MKGTVQLVQTNNNRDIVELPRQLELGLVWKGLNLGGGGVPIKELMIGWIFLTSVLLKH